jgi:DNA-binding NarL/FixJ family response regulator
MVPAHDVDTFERVAKVTFLMRYFHQDILRIWSQANARTSGLRARLTPRETQVMVAIGDGLTSQEIASSMLISSRTVDSYVRDVQVKLRAESRQQALCKVISLGLLQPSRHYAAEQIDWVI